MNCALLYHFGVKLEVELFLQNVWNRPAKEYEFALLVEVEKQGVLGP